MTKTSKQLLSWHYEYQMRLRPQTHHIKSGEKVLWYFAMAAEQILRSVHFLSHVHSISCFAWYKKRTMCRCLRPTSSFLPLALRSISATLWPDDTLEWAQRLHCGQELECWQTDRQREKEVNALCRDIRCIISWDAAEVRPIWDRGNLHNINYELCDCMSWSPQWLEIFNIYNKFEGSPASWSILNNANKKGDTEELWS